MTDSTDTDTIDLSTVDSKTLTRELGRRIRAAADACPEWCPAGHDPECLARGNYHHDGVAQVLTLDPRSISADLIPTVHVKPALFVPSSDDSRNYVAQIELRTEDETLLELMVEDAAWLSDALQQAVAAVAS